MSKLKSDFKVFVSDEILDFRTLEEKYTKTSSTTFPPRTRSQDAIDVNKLKKDTSTVNSPQVTTPENISKPLYDSTTTLAEKYRNSRLKGRSRTVDPRFRKSRSPPRKVLTSQSTADLFNPSMSHSHVKKKPFSPNHLPSSTNRDSKRPPKYIRDPHGAETKSPVNLQHKHAADKEDHDSCIYHTAVDDEPDRRSIYAEEQKTRRVKQEKYDIDSMGDSCNISPIHSPDITEDDIIEDSESQHNLEDRELDGYADKISPYWDDPRLLEKHDVVQPIRSQPNNDSVEIPLAAKDCNGILVCRNCLATQWITPEYNYDDRTEICNSFFNSNDNVHKKYSEKDEYSTTVVPYMVLGSAVGILIVSFVGWFVSQHFSWDFSKLWPNKTSSPPPEIPLLNNVLYWMDTLYTKACELILMPRSGIIYQDVNAEEPRRWWSSKM